MCLVVAGGRRRDGWLPAGGIRFLVCNSKLNDETTCNKDITTVLVIDRCTTFRRKSVLQLYFFFRNLSAFVDF